MKARRKQIIYHITGCILFLVLPLTLTVRTPQETGIFFSKSIVIELLSNTLLLIFFYFNFYVLIPKFYLQKKYRVYFVIVLLAGTVITLLPSIIVGDYFWQDHFHHASTFNYHRPSIDDSFRPKAQQPSFRPSGPPFLSQLKNNIYLLALVILFSILLQVNNRLLEIDKERVAAELANLKAQIHPHFLFNTLNSIYALSVTKDEKAPDSIVKLSEFMRYLLKDANENQVLLSKEIEYISNYLDLQRSRLRDSVQINYQLSGMAANISIAPLLLFSFIENAFKHGVNPEEDSQINIHIAVLDTSVEMRVRNNKVKVHNKENSLGVGISNSSQRLARLYPERHKLEIENQPNYFLVTLLIELS